MSLLWAGIDGLSTAAAPARHLSVAHREVVRCAVIADGRRGAS